jgi:PAS domain S-box-containing protein
MNKQSDLAISILVVEDNPGDYFIVEDYLTDMFPACDIVHADTYQNAMSKLNSLAPIYDIILLDISLPDKSGLDLIKEVLNSAKHIPVIVLTGYENFEFSINSLATGITDYLLKDEINAYTLFKSILFSLERNKYTKTLTESQRRYTELFNLSPIPVWVYVAESLKFKDVNQAALMHYGYSFEEFKDMSLRDIVVDFEHYESDEPHKGKVSASIQKHVLKSGEIIDVKVEKNTIVVDDVKCIIMLSNDITDLLATQSSLVSAYKEIIEIEESEKQKLAAEVHDNLGQMLVAINMYYQSLIAKASFDNRTQKILNNLSELISRALKECSSIVNKIRPKALLENNFEEALDNLISQYESLEDYNIYVNINFDIQNYFDDSELMHVFRIVQELFNNTIKHAQAKVIYLDFEEEKDKIKLRYIDDGVGISQEMISKNSSFLGLKRRMRILHATYQIKSELNNGLKFEIGIPKKTPVPIEISS